MSVMKEILLFAACPVGVIKSLPEWLKILWNGKSYPVVLIFWL